MDPMTCTFTCEEIINKEYSEWCKNISFIIKTYGTRGKYDYLTALDIAVLPFVDFEKIQGFGTEGYWAQCVNWNILEVFRGNVHLKYTK